MPVESISNTVYSSKGNVPGLRAHSNRLFLKETGSRNVRKPASQKELAHFANVLMTGTYNDIHISYPTRIKARRLAAAETVAASLIRRGCVLFTWTDNSCLENAHRNDRVILTTWFPELKKMVYTLLPVNRGTASAQVEMTIMRGFIAHTWIGFVSHDEREAADSVYAGRIVL